MNLEQFARARGLHKMLTTNRQAVELAYNEAAGCSCETILNGACGRVVLPFLPPVRR